MWEIMLILLFMTALIVTLLVIFDDYGIYWNTVLSWTAIIIWTILAFSQLAIFIPYEMYNSDLNMTLTGYHKFYDPSAIPLMYLFNFFSIAIFIHWFGLVIFPALKQRWMR